MIGGYNTEMKTAIFSIFGSLVVIFGIAYLLQVPTRQNDIGDIRFGFIRAVEGSGPYAIAFDEARWLTGEAAENAAIASGRCSEETRSECLPNGFFILNESDNTESYAIADDAIIAMMTLNMETENVHETQVSQQQFSDLINDEAQHWHELPYQMLVKDGVVTIIEEVYIP